MPNTLEEDDWNGDRSLELEDSKGNTYPCHCPLCGGKKRNRKTIRRHFSAFPIQVDQQNSSNEAQPVDEHTTRSYHSGYHVEQAPLIHSGLLFASNNVELELEEETFPGSEDENSFEHDPTNETFQGSEIEDSFEHDPTNETFQGSEDENSFDPEPANETFQGSEDENSFDPEPANDNTGKHTEEEIKNAVLRCLECKVKNGWSQEECLSQLRNIYELVADERIPHKSWNSVMTYLKKLGYRDPKKFKVCCGTDHVTLLEDQENCPNCDKPKEKCIDYHVLGINLESCFLNESTIKDHLEHWQHKEEWMEENAESKYKEIWNGERFKELAYFWDENVVTFLPCLCPHCETIISVEVMESTVPPGHTLNDQLYLSCHECMNLFLHTPKKMRGCPLNQAFIFHEDGFNAFDKKSRSISAVHISSACISKEKRSTGKYMKVFSFVPSVYLGEGIHHKMDAFLKPLIDEVKELYINGITVTLEKEINLQNGIMIKPGEYQVRMLLLCGTADLKGHQEILLYAGGGRLGCRCCLCQGSYLEVRRHYYYGRFGERFRNPSKLKTAAYYLENGKMVESATTITERKRRQTATGVTGVSILFELHSLYNFDPVNDMVIDRMHLTFNMLKREFINEIWRELGPNADRPINTRDPAVGGLIERDKFELSLNAVSWPKEEKASGVARLKSLTDKLGSWKSNEFKKFSSIAREVLAGIVPSKAYDSYMLICNAVQMLYSRELRIFGWTEQNVLRLNNLLWAHAIQAEEFYGLRFCTENLEYSTHAAAQIRRHSSMDNYSCELYERAIRIHKKQKHNSKGLEKTFVDRECIRAFIETWKEKNGPISSYHDKPNYDFKLDTVDGTAPFHFKESSFDSAFQLLKDVKETEDLQVKHAVQNGVAIGKIKRTNISQAVEGDIKRFLINTYGNEDVHVDIQVLIKTLKCVAVLNQFQETDKLSRMDTVAIKGGNQGEVEWICRLQISTLLVQYMILSIHLSMALIIYLSSVIHKYQYTHGPTLPSMCHVTIEETVSSHLHLFREK